MMRQTFSLSANIYSNNNVNNTTAYIGFGYRRYLCRKHMYVHPRFLSRFNRLYRFLIHANINLKEYLHRNFGRSQNLS